MTRKQKKDTRGYPVFIARNGDGFGVEFPDLQGCVTCAETVEDALSRAKEALEGFICFSEADGDVLPPPTPLEKLRVPEGAAAVLVNVRMDLVRSQQENASVAKSVTLPAWLNRAAMEAKLSFSRLLQDAPMRELDIKRA